MKLKKIFGLLLAALVGLAMLSLSVYAEENASIAFSYVTGGVEFKLYKVGDVNDDGSFSLNGQFEKYSISLTDSNAASTLALYARRDNINSLRTEETDKNGQIIFSNLDNGIYLIVGETVKKDRVTYTSQPVLAKTVSGETIEINGKFESETDPPGSSHGGGSGGGGGHSSSVSYRKITAVKVWKGDGEKEEVTVQLLRNGKVEKEAVLNEDNNWRYEWSVTSRTDTWSVVEKTVPKGYVVSIEKDGMTYVITNTPENEVPKTPGDKENPKNPETPGTPNNPSAPGTPDNPNTPGTPNNPGNPGNPDTPNYPNTPGTPGSSNPNEPGNPQSSITTGTGDQTGSQGLTTGGFGTGISTGENDTSDSNTVSEEKSTSNEKLPQTGQLWWPVAILSFLGGLLLIVGIGLKREGK